VSRPDKKKSEETALPSLPLPLDEPILTIKQAAEILHWSQNQTSYIFRLEDGVYDLSRVVPRNGRQRRRLQLRIPFSVLSACWRDAASVTEVVAVDQQEVPVGEWDTRDV